MNGLNNKHERNEFALLAASLTLAVLVGCGGGGSDTPKVEGNPEFLFAGETIHNPRGYKSNVAVPKMPKRITDQATLERLLKDGLLQNTLPLQWRKIDFNKTHLLYLYSDVMERYHRIKYYPQISYVGPRGANGVRDIIQENCMTGENDPKQYKDPDNYYKPVPFALYTIPADYSPINIIEQNRGKPLPQINEPPCMAKREAVRSLYPQQAPTWQPRLIAAGLTKRGYLNIDEFSSAEVGRVQSASIASADAYIVNSVGTKFEFLRYRVSDEQMFREVSNKLPDDALPMQWRQPDWNRYDLLYLQEGRFKVNTQSAKHSVTKDAKQPYHIRIVKLSMRPDGLLDLQPELCGVRNVVFRHGKYGGEAQYDQDAFALYAIPKGARGIVLTPMRYADAGRCITTATVPKP